MKVFAFLMFYGFMSGVVFAQNTAQEWQAKVIKLYPDLAREGSALNKAYVRLYKTYKETRPNFFTDSHWPLDLANQANQEIAAMAEPKNEAADDKPDMADKADPAPDKAASAKQSNGITLDRNWDPRMGGGSGPMRELYTLLSRHGSAEEDKAAHPDIEIYGGVHYLEPLESAQKKLGLGTKWSARNTIATPGLPQTLFWITYDGRFEGHFNQLELIVDRSNQVVSVQLVDEHFHGIYRENSGWHTYNFVNMRVNGSSRQSVASSAEGYNNGGAIIHSELLGGSGQNTRWYVPKPLVSLILHCIEKANAK